MGAIPNPASLTLLENLGKFPVRSKVRFLGCIELYDPVSAILTVAHRSLYGESRCGAAQNKTQRAKVDIANLVRTLETGTIHDGEWINIIGYILDPPNSVQVAPGMIYIQAVHLWSSGAINLGEYERLLREKLAVDKDTLEIPKTEP